MMTPLAAMVSLLAVGQSPAAPSGSPDAGQIKEAIAEVLKSSAYDLDMSSRYRIDLTWLWDFLRWLFKPLVRFLDMLSNLSPVAYWVVIIGLITVAVALTAHIVYTVFAAIKNPRYAHEALDLDTVQDPALLKSEAERCAAQGDYVGASRMLFRAALLMLEAKRGGHLLTGLTNTEYLRTFRSEWVVENLRVFVNLINWKWYRDKSFDADDYAQCRRAFSAIETRLAQET